MVYENILFDVSDGIATITLDRNDTRNALSWGMANDLSDALDRLGAARVLVITGAGKGFCSGGDMSSPVVAGMAFGDMLHDGIIGTINPMLAKLHDLRIPVISAVNGAAAGAGAPLALSADFVIAGASAFFYFAFANVGLAVDAGASWLLPRLIGTARAMQALVLAERIPAAQALDWGMIYKAVPDADLQAETRALAIRLAAGPTLSYGLIRAAVQQAAASDYRAALAQEAQAQRVAGNSADCAEAVAAFLEKRAAVFRGV
jgi:2-(1,2-epoxy-1,2-dihydrophenyl)acetyl-CoA isomerase